MIRVTGTKNPGGRGTLYLKKGHKCTKKCACVHNISCKSKKVGYYQLFTANPSTLPLGHELEAEWLRAMSLSNGR